MKLSEEIKELVQKTPFIPLVTYGKEGPHLIVVGTGFVVDDQSLAFFGWRQGVTSKNIQENGVIQIAVVAPEKNKGFRLEGKARIEREGKIFEDLKQKFPKKFGQLSFATVMEVEKVESLL